METLFVCDLYFNPYFYVCYIICMCYGANETFCTFKKMLLFHRDI